MDYDEERDLIRPEYEAHVTRERINPVNKIMEPYLNPVARFSRCTFSIVTVIFWVSRINISFNQTNFFGAAALVLNTKSIA